MASVLQIATADLQRRIRWVQAITIAWMVVEATASLFAARRADSPALFGFGGDSLIELLSAAIVFWGFRTRAIQPYMARNLTRLVGGLLIALAAFVVATSIVSLAGRSEPRPTLLGIAILIVAAVIMPLLAREKRKLSAATGSAALRADAVQSGTCAYLSLIALVGLAANAVWRVPWADPVAALAIVPFVVWEGREAARGKPCECC